MESKLPKVDKRETRTTKISRAIEDIKSRHNFGTPLIAYICMPAHILTQTLCPRILRVVTFRYAIRRNIAGAVVYYARLEVPVYIKVGLRYIEG